MGLSDQVLEIVFAGWLPREGHEVIPIAMVVSNLPGRFAVTPISIRANRPSAVIPIGQRITQEELAGVNRAVKRLCDSDRDTARSIAQVLTELVRTVARSPTRRTYVSDDVLVTSLPREDLLSGGLVVGKLVEDWWPVTNIIGGSSRLERHGGPILVAKGAVIQALPPEDGPPGPGFSMARDWSERGRPAPLAATS